MIQCTTNRLCHYHLTSDRMHTVRIDWGYLPSFPSPTLSPPLVGVDSLNISLVKIKVNKTYHGPETCRVSSLCCPPAAPLPLLSPLFPWWLDVLGSRLGSGTRRGGLACQGGRLSLSSSLSSSLSLFTLSLNNELVGRFLKKKKKHTDSSSPSPRLVSGPFLHRGSYICKQ